MWKYGLYLLALVAIALSLSGCGGGPGSIQACLNEEFSLSIGQSAFIAAENLQIRFAEIVEDSRCPKDVICIWAGRVSCIVELSDGHPSYRMVLTEPGLTDQYSNETFREYQLAFHVKPYPEAGEEITADEYRLLLIISK